MALRTFSTCQTKMRSTITYCSNNTLDLSAQCNEIFALTAESERAFERAKPIVLYEFHVMKETDGLRLTV